MHAWMLVLTVLATFNSIDQVASTDNITARFSTVISQRTAESTFHPVQHKFTLAADQRQYKDQLHRYKKYRPRSITTPTHADQVNSVVDTMGDNEPTYSNKKKIISEEVNSGENSLLSLFKNPPKIDRSKVIIPDAMKQLYKQTVGDDIYIESMHIPKQPGIHTRSANTVRSFTHQDSKIDDQFPHHYRFRHHFDIKSIPNMEKLMAAYLQLNRDAISPRVANRTRYQVLVYDITLIGARSKQQFSYLLLDIKTVRLNSTDTISLDVQPAVSRWLDSPKNNYGLLVEVRMEGSLEPAPHHHVRLRRSADEPDKDWQHKQPLLMIYTDDGQQKPRPIRDMSKRSKQERRRRKKTRENCRRHELYVDFSDVGWNDWILAPTGYDSYYCEGACRFPLAEHMNSTNHAVVQTIFNNINPGKVARTCCVATETEGISMLFLSGDNQVVIKNYPDMAVVGCGCR